MTPIAHFGLFSQSPHVSFGDCQKIAAAVQAQITQDWTPVWGRTGTIVAYAQEADVPVHIWKVVIEDDIGQPGALGYHTDELNQPIAFVAAQGGDINAVSKTVSHEVLETLGDPFGNRLIPALSPHDNKTPVRILCEVCDPSEDRDYKRLGLDVSDFYFPEWFDAAKTTGQKYSFLDALTSPRTLVEGGYISWVDAKGKWWQITSFDGGIPKLEGPFNWELEDGKSIREMVDGYTTPRKNATS